MGKTIFRFEMKRQLIPFCLWTAALIGVLWGLMAGVYPTFQESAADIQKVVEGFPPQFAAAFGVNISDIFSFGGYYSFCFAYLGVMGAIMAASVGISIFSRERRAQCSDFLMTKPVSRGRIFTWKLVSGLFILTAANVIYLITAAAIGRANDTPMMAAGLSLLMTQLVFFALGIFYAVFAKRVRSVSGAATAFGFGAFLLSALYNIIGEEALRVLVPLKYFEPAAVFNQGRYEMRYALMGCFVGVVCLLSAYIRYTQSDIRAI